MLFSTVARTFMVQEEKITVSFSRTAMTAIRKSIILRWHAECWRPTTLQNGWSYLVYRMPKSCAIWNISVVKLLQIENTLYVLWHQPLKPPTSLAAIKRIKQSKAKTQFQIVVNLGDERATLFKSIFLTYATTITLWNNLKDAYQIENIHLKIKFQ